MIILFLIVFIGLVGFGIILPLFPFYAERFGASPEVITWTMSAYTLSQALATPVWGRLSDAYGRRLVLILTMLGSVISYLLLAYADELWLVLFSRVLGGLMAGNIATAFAYVTDITTEDDRSASLGKIGAAMGLGFIFGPAIGGLLAGAEVETANYVLPALAAAALSLV
ncbi:MAG: MFS transporter, partial [Gammaproteobacteria bacterium]|nr:MFS transporter [Gammaproteobacteria bacterium]